MPDFIVAWRNPRTKRLSVVTDDSGEVAQFKTFEEADRATRTTTVCKFFPSQILEVDEA